MERLKRLLIVLLVSCLVPVSLFAQTIRQERGVDQRVDYKMLTKFGPWDDRNYKVRLEDLKLLAPNEEELTPRIPVFFRIEMRKNNPHFLRTGPAQYPRSASQLFRHLYGGLMVDGVIQKDGEEGESLRNVPVNHEIQLSDILGANEISVEINPVYSDRVIAGANGSGGQDMYYSSDGGLIWVKQGTLPDTCCDPTVGWSSDGTIAYAGALSFLGGRIGVDFYRSTDFGHTWGSPIRLTTQGSDKEFLHVDISLVSPYKDNIYLAWHDGNTMQFARSTDFGLSFDPTISFSSQPSGIGHDLTTDSAGNIYYIYPGISAKKIILLKSTDGGDSFLPYTTIADTNGAFDFPIPAMETRNAWIYVAADADRSSGPYAGSIYACWTDTTGAESGSASQNHTRIVVAYSRDAGDTWNTSIPHPNGDSDSVDRFNHWMAVDQNGVVHVVYYDTRNSANRSGVDLYYTYSQDGAVTWATEERITSRTSANLTDGQEWGDYNGISVLYEKIIPAWTDNREGPPNSKDVYVADVTNVTANPNFSLDGDPLTHELCIPGDLEPITVDVGSRLGFSEQVTLSFVGFPQGFSGNFSGNTILPPGQSTASVSVDAIANAGENQFIIRGSAAGVDDKDLTVTVQIQLGAVSSPTLISPADGAVSTGINNVAFSWSQVADATSYRIQISTSETFSPLFLNTATAANSLNASGFSQDQLYYWRVAAINACAQGPFSSTFEFTASLEPVLVVDQDDNVPDVQGFFTDVLDQLGLSYRVFDILAKGQSPVAADMVGHDLVIWFSGDRFSGPTSSNTNELETYLNSGGNLFLSSQDYLYPYYGSLPSFAQNYLGVGSVVNDGGNFTTVAPSVGGIFDGLSEMQLVYPTGHQKWPDHIDTNAGGDLALVGDDLGGAAISTSNTVFFVFPFSAIANNGTSEGRQVMTAIWEHFFPSLIVYTNPSGCGANQPCRTTIQEAIDKLTSEPTIIRIIAGEFTESVLINISGTVTLQGGWNNAFTAKSASTPTTILGSPIALVIRGGTVVVESIVLR